MSDVRVVRPDAPMYTPHPSKTAEQLQYAVEEQMRRVANLRGYSGQLRRAIRDAFDNTPPGTPAYTVLASALSIPSPEEPAA